MPLRLIGFVLSAILAVALGFVLIPAPTALGFVQHAGYYVILAGVALFLWSFGRLLRSDGIGPRWLREKWLYGLLAAVFAGLWQVNGLHGFKVLMDELVLGATAMSMHFDREVFVILKAHDLNGVYASFGGLVDKRPVLFPFLLSLLHDLTGYRPENVFVLNGMLSWLALFLAGVMGERLGGKRGAGVLALLLLGGLPLLGTTATSGGMDLLNVVMIEAVFLLALRWLSRRDAAALDALVLGTVLLAQARYESALFVPLVGVLILWGWWRQRAFTVSPVMIAAPWLLILVPFQNKVFFLNERFWQLKEGASAPFEGRFVADNLGHLANFLFTVDGNQLGSPVLSAIGLVSTLVFVVYVLRRWRSLPDDPVVLVAACVFAGVLANLGLLLCYHWGQLDDFVATRLGLPLMLVFALTSAFFLGRKLHGRRLWHGAYGVAAVWAVCWALPIYTRAEATRAFLSYQEVRWQRAFIQEHHDTRDFYALPSPLPAVLERKPAISIEALAERAEQMETHLKARTYRNVYVFQRIVENLVNGGKEVAENSRLGPEFILEPLDERRFRPGYVMRVSRLVAVDLSKMAPRPPDWKPSFPPFLLGELDENATPEERKFREFLENLP